MAVRTQQKRGVPKGQEITEECLYVKVHKRDGTVLVAVCDKCCIGKTYEEGGMCIDLKKHSDFYRGELCTKKQALEKLKQATSINLAGEIAVSLGEELGLVKKKLKIGGLPHAQAYML